MPNPAPASADRRTFLSGATGLSLSVAGGSAALLQGCALDPKSADAGGSPARPRAATAARAPAGSRDAAQGGETVDSDERRQATPQALARATLLANRLGFGPRPGDIELILRVGERNYIDSQLDPQRLPLPDVLQAELDGLATLRMPVSELLAEYQGAIRDVLARQAATPRPPGPLEQTGRRPFLREVALDTNRNRLLRALDSPRQLEEVMVDFWYNHFNVYVAKGLDRALVGHYERHAIRPHAMGRFRDLLGATARHPAMLFYLDNAQSVATGFSARRPPGAPGPAPSGLNENYARELMELHTLGADGGYTQRDVTELARMLTGWTFTRQDRTGDAFRFEPSRHDTGVKHWLGHRIEPSGQAEGEFALDVLAAHPATARRIAFKLAQHFVADAPPPDLVGRLAERFTRSGGDTRAVLRALFESAEFWDLERTKFKTPYQYVLSSMRAAGQCRPNNVLPLVTTLAQMGMPLYGCPTPDGYKNTESDWLNAEAMTRRLNFATALAAGRLPLGQRVTPAMLPTPGENAATGPLLPGAQAANPNAQNAQPLDWNALLATLGPLIRPHTRGLIAASAEPLRASLVLGSPDFMRR